MGLSMSVPASFSPATSIIFPPFMFPAMTSAREHNEQSHKDEYAGPEEAMKRDPGVIVLYHKETPYEDKDQPGAAPEAVPYAHENTYSNQEHVPVEEPVRQGESHLIQQEQPSYEQDKQACPYPSRRPAMIFFLFVRHCMFFLQN